MPKPEECGRRVAIVTGGATGVGAATALKLADRGLDVAIVYSRSATEASETLAALRARGADALALRCDVASDADCRRAADDVVARWGRIDVLVNSAGTTHFVPMGDLDAQSGEDFHQVFGVNAVGPFQMARAVAPAMRQGRRGSVVNVSSVGSLNGNGSSYAYVASKAALNVLTLALARNLAPEIRVNAVLPGFIETRWLKRGLGEEAYERVRANWLDAAALRKVCSAAEIAEAIVWLALDAEIATGQLLTVDGGFMLGRPAHVSR
jgi:3-oxoacyl-[acyl-carrier protein] reductase